MSAAFPLQQTDTTPRPAVALLQIGTTLRRAVTLGLALIWAHSAWASSPCSPTTPNPGLVAVLPGIEVIHGRWPALDTLTPDHMATTVVLSHGPKAVVIDPGATHASGTVLRQWLRCQRRQRVVQVINSHAHAENVLANSAFFAAVAATADTQSAMRQRCPDCLAALHRDLGDAALRGTRIVLPQQRLQNGHRLHASGRSWQVLDMRHAHTESDLVLWSAPERIVLAGPLVDGERLVLAQGSVLGWLQALHRIEALQPRWLIGQHRVAGPGQVQTALQAQRQALCALVHQAWQGLERGWNEAEALQHLPLQGDGALQRQQHFNLLRAWREMEALWMDRQPMPGACSGPDIGR